MTYPLPKDASLSHSDPAGADELKGAMRHLAAGVCVVTAGLEEDRTGATVTSATALSIDPPTIIVNINRSASIWPVLSKHGHFCVNILSSGQRAVAERFSGRNGEKGAARYEGARWTALKTGALALEDALASIDCEVEEIIERHTHAIIIGRVLEIVQRAGEPLLYHDGGFRTLIG